MRRNGRTFAGIVALVGVVASIACSSGTQTTTPDLFVTPYGSCVQANTFLLLTAAQSSQYCPSFACSGTTYALCDGAAWAACDCKVPPGWTGYVGSPGFGVFTARDGSADAPYIPPGSGSGRSSGSGGRDGGTSVDSSGHGG